MLSRCLIVVPLTFLWAIATEYWTLFVNWASKNGVQYTPQLFFGEIGNGIQGWTFTLSSKPEALSYSLANSYPNSLFIPLAIICGKSEPIPNHGQV